MKAAYLFNFGKFVKWPKSDASHPDGFPICVLGTDPFGGVLDSTVSGEEINGKKVTVRHLQSASEGSGCRIVFIGRSEQERLGTVLETLSRWPVLTVSDIDEFTQRRGMIQFVMDGDRVRFKVNLSAAKSAGLTLSSELLKVATSVEGKVGR